MGHERIKTEMKGTGGGRWTTRAEAKASSKKRRRRADKKAAKPSKDEPRRAPTRQVRARLRYLEEIGAPKLTDEEYQRLYDEHEGKSSPRIDRRAEVVLLDGCVVTRSVRFGRDVYTAEFRTFGEGRTRADAYRNLLVAFTRHVQSYIDRALKTGG